MLDNFLFGKETHLVETSSGPQQTAQERNWFFFSAALETVAVNSEMGVPTSPAPEAAGLEYGDRAHSRPLLLVIWPHNCMAWGG